MKSGLSLVCAAAVAIGGCSTPPGAAPSLGPRAAETIDPRVPVSGSVSTRPVDPALAARLSLLVSQARANEGAFRAAIAEADRLAAAAGAPQSESWIAAQQALSAAVAARGPTARALADVDATAAEAIKARGDLSPADLAAVEAAAAELAALDRVQAELIATLQRRLGG